MQRWKVLAASIVAVAAISALVYQLLPTGTERAPAYEWECSQCQHRFRQSIPDAAADRSVINCPKCGALSAERLMRYQCRNCWTKYELRGSKASLQNMICPSCGSRAARDLDHPIPGDDEPIDGGKPNPEK